MRFSKHINENSPREWEVLRDTLTKDCMPYIKQLKGAKNLLWRGMVYSIPFYRKMSQRQDRKPRVIDHDLHQQMDRWTQKNWGFKARSQSTFTTRQKEEAYSWGDPYIIFPIGNFGYAWNDDVTELYGLYDGWAFYENEYDDPFDRYVIYHLQKYKTNNLNKYLKLGPTSDVSECIVNCKTYYAIHQSWEATLLGWFSDRHWRQK